MVAYHLLITVITLIMALTSPHPLPDPAHIAGICKGEASFAIEECACSVHNRIELYQWNREKVMSAYKAKKDEPTSDEIAAVANILAGQGTCDSDLYFMLSPSDIVYLGMSHIKPAATVMSPDGHRQVSFFPREAWGEREP